MSRAYVLTGNEIVNRRLAKLAGKQSKDTIRKASREALRPMAAVAKSNAPSRTGRLRRSIKVRALRRSRGRVGSRVSTSKYTGDFAGREFYGGFQEYGWKVGRRTRNSDLGLPKGGRRTDSERKAAAKRDSSRKSVEGKHFMENAFDTQKRPALARYLRALKKWVNHFASQ